MRNTIGNRGVTLALLIILLCSVFLNDAVAQKLTAQAPQLVAVGQQFRLTYTADSHDVSGFRIGSEAF